MSDNRRSSEDEEPQEEFVNDGFGKSENKEPGPNKLKLEEWPLRELQQKAQEENISGHEKMNREELIKKLRQRR